MLWPCSRLLRSQYLVMYCPEINHTNWIYQQLCSFRGPNLKCHAAEFLPCFDACQCCIALKFCVANLTFRETCIVIYSYNESQWDALFLKIIWWSTLHVSDMSTVHHQEYLNTIYTQQVFVMLVLLAWQIPIACIQCWDTPDDGQWTCPKHVEYFMK